MEMTMRNKLLTVILVQLVAALTAQAAAASEHHHTRAKGGPVISERLRSSNAYAAPTDMSAPSGMPDYAEGAMSSGIAGH
jgi:hypothetical protein